MERYESVELEIIVIDSEDVIVTSPTVPTPPPGPIELPIIPVPGNGD